MPGPLAPEEMNKCDISHNAPLFEAFDEKLKGTGYKYERHQAVT